MWKPLGGWVSVPATGDGQSETSSASSKPAQLMFRIRRVLVLLPVVGAVAAVVIWLSSDLVHLHGWDWALAGVGVLVVSWLWSYRFSPTPWSARFVAPLWSVGTKVVAGALLGWGLLCCAAIYLWFLAVPFFRGLQTREVGAPLWHVLVIVVLIAVTFHLLFPMIEPKRRAVLVWHVTQGKLTAKWLFALYFGVIVSASIALWDQMLLLLAKHDVVGFYVALPKVGAAQLERVSLTDLINGNDIFYLLVWQLFDMVPTLKVNDTIGFEQPLFYDSLAGWLVLVFKVIVGFALIGSVLAIVKAQQTKPDKPAEISLLPRTTQRILPRWPRARRPGPDISAPETTDP